MRISTYFVCYVSTLPKLSDVYMKKCLHEELLLNQSKKYLIILYSCLLLTSVR